MQKFVYIMLALILTLMISCSAHQEDIDTANLARLEPSTGVYFGVNLDWGQDSAAAFNQRLGLKAAVYVSFFTFPFSGADLGNVDQFIEQVAQEQGLALITLEPRDGLNTITPSVADDLAERLASYNRRGVPIFI